MAGFIGSKIEVAGVYPTLESVEFGPYLVTPQVGTEDFEFIASDGIDEVWDISKSAIKIEITESITAADAEYNAWHISDVLNTLPDISHVRIIKSKTTASFDASMIEWNDHEILINYVKDGSGISLQAGQTLFLRVGFDPTTGSNRHDVIVGTADRDILKGLKGADSIDGKAGADRIVGGRGDDYLKGGGGRDRFVFVGASGDDRIEDFKTGTDKIILKRWDATEFSELSVEETTGGLLIADGHNSILLSGTSVLAFESTDLVFG